MKILFISNQIVSKNEIANPVIANIINEINEKHDCHNIDFIGITPRLRSIKKLIKSRKKKYDVIHFHFGGLYSWLIIFFLFQKSEKYITFHGTDIHGILHYKKSKVLKKIKVKINRYFSLISFIFFDHIGLVSKNLQNHIPKWYYSIFKEKIFIQHLGVDYKIFKPIDKQKAKKKIGVPLNSKKLFLFSSISSSPVKRFDIAQSIVHELGEEYQLLKMTNVKPDFVPYYIASSDYILLTSDAEGSPNIIREGLALNKPIFSVDVGDVRQQIKSCSNCLVIDNNPLIASKQIMDKLKILKNENTRKALEDKISLEKTTIKLINFYNKNLEK